MARKWFFEKEGVEAEGCFFICLRRFMSLVSIPLFVFASSGSQKMGSRQLHIEVNTWPEAKQTSSVSSHHVLACALQTNTTLHLSSVVGQSKELSNLTLSDPCLTSLVDV